MSIASSIYAEYANKMREEWATALKEAIQRRDWNSIEQVFIMIDQYCFLE